MFADDAVRSGDAELASKDKVKQLEFYNQWNQINYRKYKFALQGAYMDWVATGHKYEVEQNFVSRSTKRPTGAIEYRTLTRISGHRW